jgi:SAM-dependent methyltransferase
MDPQTRHFYATRAEEWAAALPHTVAPRLDPFLDLLPAGARILDLGCGDGRDAAHMEARGFAVDATDGVESMVTLTSQRLARPARLMRFDELEASVEYDAVWAYAALLHVPLAELPGIIARVHRALKPGGWHFASFKGGDGGHRDPFGRFYSYLPRPDLESAYSAACDWSHCHFETEMGGSYGAGPTPWHFVTARKPV